MGISRYVLGVVVVVSSEIYKMRWITSHILCVYTRYNIDWTSNGACDWNILHPILH
jgi:hypothetical protein